MADGAQTHDYSEEVRKHRSLTVRWIFALLGAVFVALGVAGMFLPILPTTPFLLLAAACFARASGRVYNWLLNHSVLGPVILEWRRHRGMPYRTKMIALVMLVVSFGISILFFVPYWQAQLAMGLFGATMAVWLYRIPSRDDPRRPPR